jgi:hypothetical protein
MSDVSSAPKPYELPQRASIFEKQMKSPAAQLE